MEDEVDTQLTQKTSSEVLKPDSCSSFADVVNHWLTTRFIYSRTTLPTPCYQPQSQSGLPKKGMDGDKSHLNKKRYCAGGSLYIHHYPSPSPSRQSHDNPSAGDVLLYTVVADLQISLNQSRRNPNTGEMHTQVLHLQCRQKAKPCSTCDLL
jgi:hypothetical protein